MYEHVSRRINPCKGLIYQKASQVYRRMAPENKRWIDPEDVLQDAMIAALRTQRSYKPDRGAKFSTYLFTGLDMAMSARYYTPLRQQKRKGAVLELDAPIGEGEDVVFREIRSSDASQADVVEAVSSAVAVCRRALPSAAVFFVGVLVSGRGRIRSWNVDAVGGLEDICREYGMGRPEMALLMGTHANKAMALEGVVGAGLKLGAEEDAKVLECLTCQGMFSLAQVRTGQYSASSLTCKSCLMALQAEERTCFGRRKVVQRTRTVEGYAEADAECRLHCRDRAACRKANREGERVMSPKEAIDELEDVSFDDVEAEEPQATATRPATEGKSSGKSEKAAKASKPAKATKAVKTVKQAKAAKPAKVEKATKVVKAAHRDRVEKAKDTKAAKAARPAKERKGREVKSAERMDPKVALKQGLIKLDEEGRDLPFKTGSMLRWVFNQLAQPGGVELKALEAKIRKNGLSPDFQLTVLRSGKSGDSGLRPYPSTHTWKVEEEKGRIRVYDLKRIAFYPKMARLRGSGKRKKKAA